MTKKAFIKLSRKHLILISALSVLTVCFSFVLLFIAFFYGKIYPNVYVNNVSVGGLKQEEALEKVRGELQMPSDLHVIVNGQQGTKFVVPTSSIEAAIDFPNTVVSAYNVGKSGSKRKDIQTLFSLLKGPQKVELQITLNREKLKEQIAVISSQIPNPPQEPQLIVLNDEVTLKNGLPGNFVDLSRLEGDIVLALKNTNNTVYVNPQQTDLSLTETEQNALLAKANVLLNKSLTLSADEKEFVYEKQELINFLMPKGSYRFDRITPPLEEVAKEVSRPPQNPVFKFEDNRVQEFSPAKDGLEVDTQELEIKIAQALDELINTDIDHVQTAIPLKRTPPDFATEDVNDLGIKELIGVGTSSYKGSIPSRVFNVAHAASKLNGVLIKPGETFSFVNTLGDISALTGYKQAYVIQGNQTVLGDGGGVCQVSTTFFRAALNAGLPIVERHPHSYRVSYYEQGSDPGIDATIFHPTVDIKIKNDTPGHILIQTFADSKNMTLRFELYGTSDGRVATVSKPVISSVTPPPEDLYIDDPNLPAGEIKQIDYKAWGAKVNFNYKVERDGEVIFEETYYSNYRPWQAKFLRGTGPAV